MPPVRSNLLSKENYVYNVYDSHKSWEAVKVVGNVL